MLTEHNQLVPEGDAQRQFIRRSVDYEQRLYTWHLEVVVRDRDLFREESKHFREMCERSEISARLLLTEVHTLSHQLNAV